MWGKMQLKNEKQSDIRDLEILKYTLFILFPHIVWKRSSILITVVCFSSKNLKLYIVDTWL